MRYPQRALAALAAHLLPGFLAGTLLATELAGQRLPFVLEARGGWAQPTGGFAVPETGLPLGSPSLGLELVADVSTELGAYFGWSRTDFHAEAPTGEPGARRADTGFQAGLQLLLPLELRGALPWVRGGAVARRQPHGAEWARGRGFEVGGGVGIPLGIGLALTPGVRYVRYRPDIGGPGSDLPVEFIVADLGVRLRP
jgi:hypothetical protein